MTSLEPDRDPPSETEPSGVISRRRGEVQLDEWVAPDVCDRLGFVRPGTALEWMNAAAGLAASRFAGAPVATVAVDGARVRRRIATGDRVAVRARVVHTTERSIGVAVAMTAGAGVPALDALMTFAAVGADGRAGAVPRFYPRSLEELAGHHEAEARARFRRDLQREVAPPARLVGRTRGQRDDARVSYVRRVEACAAMTAASFLSTPPHLLGVDGLAFLRPTPADTPVHLDARAVHSDDLGMTVMVTAHHVVPRALGALALRGFFTYAPVDPTCAIPRLARVGRDEAIFCEVALRHRLREALTDLRS